MDVSKLIETSLTLDVVKTSPSKKLVVLSAGAMKTMQDGKEKLGLLVEIDGKQLNWYPNKTSLKKMAAYFGVDSLKWVGKQVSLTIGVINGKEAVLVTVEG